MKILRAVFVIVLLCGVPSLSQAQSYIDFASTSCGTWVSERKKDDSYYAAVLKAWVSGVVSGATASSGGNKDWLKGADAASLYVWLDNTCGKNPLMRFPDAVLALVQELRSR